MTGLQQILMLVLLVSSICGCCIIDGDAKKFVKDVAQAENQLVTDTGRYLATGGYNTYEIEYDAMNDTYSKIPLFPTTLYCYGIVQVNDYIYVMSKANVSDMFLWASPLGSKASDIHFRPILDLAAWNFTLPNGMALDAQNGYLYLANSGFTHPASGSILQVILSTPLTVKSVQFVLRNTGHPNGLKVFDGTIYWTSLNQLWSKTVGDPTAPSILLFERDASFLDEITIDMDGDGDGGEDAEEEEEEEEKVVVDQGGRDNKSLLLWTVDYIRGTLLQLSIIAGSSSASILVESRLDTCAGPSSMLFGRGLAFVANSTVLISEKGILDDFHSSIGNSLSQVGTTDCHH